MSIFSKTSPENTLRIRKPDVQARPAIIGDGEAATPLTLKVDFAYRVGSLIVIVGWSTRPVSLRIRAEDQIIDLRTAIVDRPDVRSHFSLSNEALPGFVLVAKCLAEEATLLWQYGTTISGESLPLRFDDLETNPPTGNALGPAWAMMALEETPHTSVWRELVAKIPPKAEPTEQARGFLEGLLSRGEGGTVAVGWVVHGPDCVSWLEDDAGETYSFDGAFRPFRQDVYEAVRDDFGSWAGVAGFVAYLPTAKARARLSLKALTAQGVHVLSEQSLGKLLPADTQAAARMVLCLASSLEDLHRRIPVVDEPILSGIIDKAREQWDGLPVQSTQLGRAAESPEVSIIVPLYGRTDFVEHQLIEFCRDAWLRQHAEVIYVVDDPKLTDAFRRQAHALYRQTKVPFTWLWGGVNRGFSGANNLGASRARGKKLLFLNSDAFPEKPGWLEALVRVLDERSDVGAVAPRLVFADGSIQHAGMQFRHEADLGIWTNHHPMMGLDPALDPNQRLAIVPAVTGACLLIRRPDFDRIGGWDTGYLIGDFEDSDLCLKLRGAGLSAAYLPTVQLTHLERQSFRLLGKDEFRTRVTIYNAVRHHTRWKSSLETADGSVPR